MTGQMKRYRESLKETPEPILLSQIQTKMDLRGLMKYAKEKGKKVPYVADDNLTVGAVYRIPKEEFESVIMKYFNTMNE